MDIIPTNNKGTRIARRAALRMLVYTAVAVAAGVTLFFHHRVREEYYYRRWRHAEDEGSRSRYFTQLRACHPAPERLGAYRDLRGPELVEAREWKRVAAVIRSGHGKAMIPTLIAALDANESNATHWEAIDALAEIGPDAAAALPAVSIALFRDDIIAQTGIMKTLKRIGPRALPVLMQALEHKNGHVRMVATMQLADIGAPAIPPLIKAMASERTVLRFNAVVSLQLMGKRAAPAASALTRALEDRDKDVRDRAQWALINLGLPTRGTPPKPVDAPRQDPGTPQ